MPWPQSLTVTGGEMSLDGSSRIVYSDASLYDLAQIVAEEVEEVTRLQLTTLQSTSPSAGDIYLKITSDPLITGEAYKVTVGTYATAEADNYNAVAMASVTLIQAVKDNGGSYSIPAMTVDDAPASDYRGFMVDLARNYHSIDTLKEVVEMCRLYKIRYLQLHLSDDQAFTFPSTAYPALAAYGHTYTLAEMNDLADYADARGVIIIPEIDVPGHGNCFVLSMPSLFATSVSGSNVINFADTAVWDALDTIIGEVLAVFDTAPYVHLGADEANLGGLGSDPDFINAINTYGVGDIGGLFNYFISYLDDTIKSYGKQTLVWEGFDHGKTGNAQMDTEIAVMMFDNYKHPDDYRNAGYPVINASWFPLYIVGNDGFGMDSDVIYQWDLMQFGNYSDPYPRRATATYSKDVTTTTNIPGAQMCSWEMPETNEIPYVRFRLAPFADRVWNPSNVNGFTHFDTRYQSTDLVLDYMLADHQPPTVPGGVAASNNIYQNMIRVGWSESENYPVGYAIYRNTVNNSSTATLLTDTLSKTTTLYEDSSIAPGQTYYYWVKAWNNWGWSGFSSAASGVTGSTNLANAYEPFNYTVDSNISGQNGGTGFSGAWNMTSSNGTVKAVASSLVYPGVPTQGGAMKVTCTTESSEMLMSRNLSNNTGYDMANVWMSFLIKPENVGSGHCFIILNENASIGKAWENGFGIWPNSNQQLVAGVTNFVVVRFDCRAGGDKIYLWVNPSLSQEPSVDNADAFKGTDDIGVGGKIGFNIQGWGFGQYIYDEIRIGSSFTDVADIVADVDAPTPNPASFATAPYSTGTSSIAMVATTGSDASGPVEYYFTCTAGGGTDSGWQTSTSYTDTGLTPNTQYTYTVTMRDSLGNTGTASNGAGATTDNAAGSTIVENTDTTYSGTWNLSSDAIYSGGSCHYGNETGAYFEITFTGNVIRWYGLENNDLGYADVYIDNNLVADNIDCYSTTRQVVLLYENTGLSSGTHTIRVVVDGSKNAASSSTFLVHDYFEYESSQAPYGGTARSIPSRIEAEHYDEGGEGMAYHDTSAGSYGGVLRTDDVDVQVGGSGYSVGWIDNGEWLEYTVDVTAGVYDITASVASMTTESMVVKLDGVTLGTVTVPNTGSFSTYQTITIPAVTVAGGSGKILRLEFVTGGDLYSLDWVDFAPATQSPYGGTARSVPGTIEAEDYDEGGEGFAYHDNDTGNIGGAYRTDGVDIETCTEGGYSIGWTVTGEWLEYMVNVASGMYDINLRVATPNDGTQITVKLGDVTLGTATLPNTGGWQNWQTATIPNVSLTDANGQILRLEFTGEFNFNRIDITSTIQKVAVLVDSELYPEFATDINNYVADVEANFSADLLVYSSNNYRNMTFEQIRSELQSIWQTENIVGVIQVGFFPSLPFDMGSHGVAPQPIGYMDMDGTFTDEGAWVDNAGEWTFTPGAPDGIYDTHYWNDNGLEIWCSVIRPYQSSDTSTDYTTSVRDQLHDFFARTHAYYNNQMVIPRRGLAYINNDWWIDGTVLEPLFNEIYGVENTVAYYGGRNSGFNYMEERASGFEATYLYCHSGSFSHDFDRGQWRGVHNTDLIPENGRGSVFTSGFNCHGADYHETPTGCMGQRYVFGCELGQIFRGCGISFATVNSVEFSEKMRDGQYAGQAHLEVIRNFYAGLESFSSSVPHHEAFAQILIGNPFVTTSAAINRSATPASISGSVIGSNDVRLTASQGSEIKGVYYSGSGSFTASNLSAGTYDIIIETLEGALCGTESVTLTAGQTLTGWDITLPNFGSQSNNWYYFHIPENSGKVVPSDWNSPNANMALWDGQGPAPVGFDEEAALRGGTGVSPWYSEVYVRKDFTVTNLGLGQKVYVYATPASLTRDDQVPEVWINGTSVTMQPVTDRTVMTYWQYYGDITSLVTGGNDYITAKSWEHIDISAPVYSTDDITTPIQAPYGGTAAVIPGTIEAEEYDEGGEGLAYHDTTAGNTGGSLRSDDVDVTTCSEGGYLVGWVSTGEWLEYTVDVTAGTYDLNLRVASTNANGQITVKLDGVTLGTASVPNTGNWQTFQTVTIPNVTVSGGTAKILSVEMTVGSLNLNWIEFAALPQSPYGGTSSAIPGLIEAEYYDEGGENVAYHDTSSGNEGGSLRTDNVDVQTCSEGGYNVGWTVTGEWLEYTADVTSGTYDIDLRVATPNDGTQITVKLDGVTLGTASLPNTGGWQTWQTVTIPNVTVSGGTGKILKLELTGEFNFNWIDFASASPTWTQIIYDDFEGGLGNWTIPGTESFLYTGGTYAYQGSNAIDLQDNNNNSVCTTSNLALSGYSQVKVDFAYMCVSMDDATEDFWLQISTDGGSSFTTVEEWNQGDEFVNDQFYTDSVTISGYTLNNQTQIRFRCDASGNADDVYIDTVTISAQ